MLIDLAKLAPDSTLEADVCIVGGGAAGISLAMALREAGLTAMLLEGGGDLPTAESQRLYAGEYVGTAVNEPWPTYLETGRLRFLGGTTNHWAGWVRPLDPIDFEARPWIPHSGWPIDFDTLIPHFKAAVDLCEVSTFPELEGEPPDEGPGMAGKGAVRDVYFYFSPPTRFGTEYKSDLVDADNIKLVLDANVTRVALTPNGQSVAQLDLSTIGGKRFTAKAKRYVLATGGVENARLLLASNDVQKAGVGNAHDQVGRYFMDHPHMNAAHAVLTGGAELYDDYQRARDWGRLHTTIPVLCLTEEIIRREKLSGGMVQLAEVRAKDLSDAQRAHFEALGGITRPLDGADSTKVVRMYLRGEQHPNPNSRVTLLRERDALGMPRARLDWQLTEGDRASLRRTTEIMGRALARRGAGRVRVLFPESGWPETRGGYHHMGTTRMSAGPASGVVDAHCKVHGVSNLYIAGSSVFTTSGFANPTFTLVALALRLADHLKERA